MRVGSTFRRGDAAPGWRKRITHPTCSTVLTRKRTTREDRTLETPGASRASGFCLVGCTFPHHLCFHPFHFLLTDTGGAGVSQGHWTDTHTHTPPTLTLRSTLESPKQPLWIVCGMWETRGPEESLGQIQTPKGGNKLPTSCLF